MRRVLIESGDRRQPGNQVPQGTRRRGGVDVDPGEIGRQGADDAVDLGGGQRARPVGVIPSVSPHRLVGMGAHVGRDQSQAVLRAFGGAEVQPGQAQTGGSQVNVAVDESRSDERAVEVDDLRAGELRSPHGVAAQPGHYAIANGHGGGIRVRRAIDPPAEQQCGHKGQCASVTFQRDGRLPHGPHPADRSARR